MQMPVAAADPQHMKRFAEHTDTDAVPDKKREFVRKLPDTILHICRSVFTVDSHPAAGQRLGDDQHLTRDTMARGGDAGIQYFKLLNAHSE
ncbi:hypothetical protein D3C81_2077410 [compost metagenome]